MEKLRIITDSGSDLCRPFPENLTVIPLTIHFGEEEYRDGETIDHKTFYEKLISGKELIPRLYDVTSGSLKVGGVDVRDYDLEVLR